MNRANITFAITQTEEKPLYLLDTGQGPKKGLS